MTRKEDMMKKLLLVLLALCMLTVSACSKEEEIPEGVAYEDLPQEIKDSLEPVYKTVLVKKTNLAGEYNYSDYEFDDEGRVISYKVSGSSKFTMTVTYDANGNVLEEYEEHPGYGYETTKYEYDENNLMVTSIEESDYSVRDGNTYHYEYEFDENGNVIKQITTLEGGDYRLEENFTLDGDGKIVQRTEETSRSTYVIDCTYDEEGNLIKEVATKQGESSSSKTTYEYEQIKIN